MMRAQVATTWIWLLFICFTTGSGTTSAASQVGEADEGAWSSQVGEADEGAWSSQGGEADEGARCGPESHSVTLAEGCVTISADNNQFILATTSEMIGKSLQSVEAGLPDSSRSSKNIDGCSVESTYYVTITVQDNDRFNDCIDSISPDRIYVLLDMNNMHFLELPKNALQNLRFERIEISYCNIISLHGSFLGASSDTTVEIRFRYNHLTYIPKLNCPSLEILVIIEANINIDRLTDLETFSLTANLKVFRIIGDRPPIAPSLTITRGVFLPLQRLEIIQIMGYTKVYLKFGSFQFRSPKLKDVTVSRLSYFAHGSIAGLPPGCMLKVNSEEFAPQVFFNVLSAGVTIQNYENFGPDPVVPCSCDLAWIRYSAFNALADISCFDPETEELLRLSGLNLEHCPFYKSLRQ